MNITCPHCTVLIARKNGSTSNGKQKFQYLSCLKQFVEDPQNKIIPADTKERIRRSLLEKVSLAGNTLMKSKNSLQASAIGFYDRLLGVSTTFKYPIRS